MGENGRLLQEVTFKLRFAEGLETIQEVESIWLGAVSTMILRSLDIGETLVGWTLRPLVSKRCHPLPSCERTLPGLMHLEVLGRETTAESADSPCTNLPT